MTLVSNHTFSIEIMRAFNIPVAPTRLCKCTEAHARTHTHNAESRGHAEGIMTCSGPEMCLWLQRLDKQGAYMKNEGDRAFYTLFLLLPSHDLLQSMLSHNAWQPASSHGNVLPTEFKDSIYRAVTTQIYCSSWRWRKDCAEGMEMLDQKTVYYSHCGHSQSFKAIIEDCTKHQTPF